MFSLLLAVGFYVEKDKTFSFPLWNDRIWNDPLAVNVFPAILTLFVTLDPAVLVFVVSRILIL